MVYISESQDPRYNKPIIGIEDERFYLLHANAIVWLGSSLLFAIAVLFASFKKRLPSTFFSSWNKCDRFVVYLSLCDIMFDLSHIMDHIQMLVTRNHTRPIELCEFYAYVTTLVMFTQNLLVALIAINAFVLMKYEKNIDFGTMDWKIFGTVCGLPVVILIGIATTDDFGPTGAFCSICNGLSGLILSTLPMYIILPVNIILYTMTWCHIRRKTKQLSRTTLYNKKNNRKALRAARNMTLFTLAFCIQYWAIPLYGTWQELGDLPFSVFMLLTTFPNTGGILNGIVFTMIRRSVNRKLEPKEQATVSKF